MTALVDAGMDVARANCAHGDPAASQRMAANVRAAAAATAGRSVMLNKGPHITEAIRTLDDISPGWTRYKPRAGP